MKKVLLFILLLPFCVSAEILILTHHYNRPDFIAIQKKTFDAFLEDDYRLVVYNDASDENMRKQIEQMCVDLGITCVRVPQELHRSDNNPGGRHQHGIDFSFEQLGYNHNDIVALFDSDLFLVKPFSIREYLKGYGLAALPQDRTDGKKTVIYLFPALVFMDMPNLPNKHTLTFKGGRVEGLACDTGAQTYYYMKNNPSVRCLLFDALYSGAIKRHIGCQFCRNIDCTNCVPKFVERGYDAAQIQFLQDCPDDDVEFMLNRNFLHYRTGSNWYGRSAQYHQTKTDALNKYLNTILANH
jgi:hypothetical protein